MATLKQTSHQIRRPQAGTGLIRLPRSVPLLSFASGTQNHLFPKSFPLHRMVCFPAKRTWDVPEETASGSIRDLLGLAAIAPSHASPTRVSQALYLFVQLLKFFVALHSLRFFLRVVATQLFKDFFDGEFVYFSHRDLLCGYAARSDWAAPSSQPS